MFSDVTSALLARRTSPSRLGLLGGVPHSQSGRPEGFALSSCTVVPWEIVAAVEVLPWSELRIVVFVAALKLEGERYTHYSSDAVSCHAQE